MYVLRDATVTTVATVAPAADVRPTPGLAAVPGGTITPLATRTPTRTVVVQIESDGTPSSRITPPRQGDVGACTGDAGVQVCGRLHGGHGATGSAVPCGSPPSDSDAVVASLSEYANADETAGVTQPQVGPQLGLGGLSAPAPVDGTAGAGVAERGTVNCSSADPWADLVADHSQDLHRTGFRKRMACARDDEQDGRLACEVAPLGRPPPPLAIATTSSCRQSARQMSRVTGPCWRRSNSLPVSRLLGCTSHR